MHVLPIGGVYEHGMGYHKNDRNVMVSTQEVHGEMYYEMVDKDSIHYVAPDKEPVYSVMLTGPLEWPDNHHKPPHKLKPLDDKEKRRLLGIFKKYFKID